MRVLVAIASYGFKNRNYLNTMISAFEEMPYEIDIVVLSNVPKVLPDGVQIRVGLPSRNPRSLPFAHRPLFIEHKDDYDLFVYAEDDTLLNAQHIEAFLSVSGLLPPDLIAGFLRYEVDSEGNKYCSTIHSHYRWKQDSVERYGEYTVARCTNDHSACYMLSREQLARAIESGGYCVTPHSGKYDMLCSAATDPYVNCGMTKVIPISHLRSFLVHHMPNVYIGKLGIPMQELERQVHFLATQRNPLIKDSPDEPQQLFPTEKKLPVTLLNKCYYEHHDSVLMSLVPSKCSSVLVVGCGLGEIELALARSGVKVTAIPLDPVLGNSLRHHGIETTSVPFRKAFRELSGRSFDLVLLQNILQHIDQPAELLRKLSNYLNPDGSILGTVPNLSRSPFGWKNLPKISSDFSEGIHRTTARILRKWVEMVGLHVTIYYPVSGKREILSRFSFGSIRPILAPNLVFVMQNGTRLSRVSRRG